MQIAKKIPEMVVKWPFMSQFHFESEYSWSVRIHMRIAHKNNSLDVQRGIRKEGKIVTIHATFIKRLKNQVQINRAGVAYKRNFLKIINL